LGDADDGHWHNELEAFQGSLPKRFFFSAIFSRQIINCQLLPIDSLNPLPRQKKAGGTNNQASEFCWMEFVAGIYNAGQHVIDH
jgi:hypothetical protein